MSREIEERYAGADGEKESSRSAVKYLKRRWLLRVPLRKV